MRSWIFILIMALAASASASSFENLLQMEMVILGQDESASVADFLGDDLLCLVLWDSQCPDCLENVAQLGSSDPPEGLRLLGINFDDLAWDAEDFIAARRLQFPQLHDPDARFAQALNADEFSFSFALLDAAGAIKAIHYDSVDNAPRKLREVVDAIRGATTEYRIKAIDPETDGGIVLEIAEAPETMQVMETSRRYPIFEHSGQIRTRGLSVSLWGNESDCECGVSGPYGERLAIQKNLLYRASYELIAEMAPGIRAGGKLRVSNEDAILFEQGPEYLSSEFGSVFGEIRQDRFSARMGYFSDHFSPLTLQRWDFADNPPAAGSGGAGCGVCGATVRGVSLEALDDLGPQITFEGLRVETSLARPLRLTTFYAIPQRAVASSGVTTDNPFAYRRDVLASRLVYSFDFLAQSRGEVAIQHLSAHEDGESSELPLSWSELPLSFIHKNEVWSASALIPIWQGLALHGETARSFERVDKLDALGESLNGAAYLAELSYKVRKRLHLTAAWQKLEPEFTSPFRALSYRSNAQGFRVSVNWTGERTAVSLFHKALERIEDLDGDMPEEVFVTSLLLGWKPTNGAAIDFVTTVNEEDPGGGLCKCERWTQTLTLRKQFGRAAEMQADLSYVRAETGSSTDGQRSMIAVIQMTAKF